MQKYLGMVGIDNGGMDLTSHMTEDMSFMDIAEWLTKSREYFRLMAKFDTKVKEIRVVIYEAGTYYEVPGKMIEEIVIRPER